MSSPSLLIPSFYILSLLLLINSGSAQTAQKPSRVQTLILPVTKDPITLQYLTTLFQRTPLKPVKLTLDAGGKSLWVACDREEYNSSTYKNAQCNSPQCKLAKSKSCAHCWDGPRPGCTNNTCSAVVYNTVEKSAQIGELGTDLLAARSTDGSNPGRLVRDPDFLFTCGSLFLGENLASGAKGIAGFGMSDISLPSLLSKSLKIPKKFAICLSSSKGVAFLGNGPYTFLPGVTVDRLVYTPILTNPISTVRPIIDDFPDHSRPSTEYFIGVESIKINNQVVPISPKLLRIDDGKGNGGTKISTVEPYTVMHTSIYNAVTKAFVKAISKVPRVAAVPPFGTCYKAASLGSTRLGAAVPTVELGLGNNATWMVFGRNSMVYVNGSEVACLGFVDGGKMPRTAIVVGGHQIEDNLLEFDLERSRLGFSSTLLGRQTTCANFNFTVKS